MDFAGIKVGVYMILQEEFPCKIAEVKFSKPGKHGSAKKTVIGIDVLTDKKHMGIYRSNDLIKVPAINHIKYTLMDISNDYYEFMNNDGKLINIRLVNDPILDKINELFANGKIIVCTLIEVIWNEQTQYRMVQYTTSD